MGVAVLILVFYKELLIASFDEALAKAMRINPTWVHYGLMAVLSVVVVSAFEAVGAILVIAMLILPGATASLLTDRLGVMHFIAIGHAAISAWLGAGLGQRYQHLHRCHESVLDRGFYSGDRLLNSRGPSRGIPYDCASESLAAGK